MSKAVLTIDDAPTKITPKIIDYLLSKNIIPVINFMGINIDVNFEESVYAAKKGIVIGNHSYSHPHFSELTLEECRDEIAKTESEIERVYKAAGVKREHKVSRFPYADKGGALRNDIQKMLRDEFHFERLDDSEINFPWWEIEHLNTDVDMIWTFDFLEYELAWNNGFTWDSIVKRVQDKKPEVGGYLLSNDSIHFVLMHDMESTNNFMDKYYEKIIDYVLSLGVEFVEPRFIKA